MIEIACVLAIIGILSAIAIPRVEQAVYKARTVEVQGNLVKIHDLELVFHSESQRYGSFSEIGFQIDGLNRYDYCLLPSLGGCIIAHSTGVSGAATARYGNPRFPLA